MPSPDDILIDFCDGDGWQFCERVRALHILSQFYPRMHLVELQLLEGAVLPIQFGGFEARFCIRRSVEAAAATSGAPAERGACAASGHRRAA